MDVRRRAGNGRKPAFAKRHLAEALAASGIEYCHLPNLAPSHELRAAEREGEIDRTGMLAGYRRELDARMDDVDELLKLVQQRRCCLMCQEAEPISCHRAVLTDLLVESGRNQIRANHL